MIYVEERSGPCLEFQSHLVSFLRGQVGSRDAGGRPGHISTPKHKFSQVIHLLDFAIIES